MTQDDDTITLKDAASHFGYTVSTLRAEADRGRLTIYKIGKRFYTTPADIKEMVKQCRVELKGHGFISTPRARIGSSATVRDSSGLSAAREIARGLRSASRNTSATSTAQPRQARR